jgi:hypothetical protein
VASGPGRPPAGPARLADVLARHHWAAAAGMTATIAAVAGGGVALALHDSSPGPPKECGLVPCAAALPASVQSTGSGSATAPATTAPAAAQRATTPPRPAHSPTSPAAPAPAEPVTQPAAPPAYRPAAAERPAGRPAAAGPVSMPEPRASCATVIAFTAGGTLGTPVRCTFSADVRPPRTRDGSGHPGSWAAGQDGARSGGQPGPGHSSHHGWQGSWLGDWLSRGWPGSGWSGGDRPGGGWSAGNWGGWPGGGQWGQHGGW